MWEIRTGVRFRPLFYSCWIWDEGNHGPGSEIKIPDPQQRRKVPVFFLFHYRLVYFPTWSGDDALVIRIPEICQALVARLTTTVTAAAVATAVGRIATRPVAPWRHWSRDVTSGWRGWWRGRAPTPRSLIGQGLVARVQRVRPKSR